MGAARVDGYRGCGWASCVWVSVEGVGGRRACGWASVWMGVVGVDGHRGCGWASWGHAVSSAFITQPHAFNESLSGNTHKTR